MKRYETANSCTSPTSSLRKRRLKEIESLASCLVQGEQVRGGILSENCHPDLCTGDKSSKPKGTLKERAPSEVIQLLRQSSTTRHTRNARNPLPEFCMSLSVGENVIIRVSDEERNDNPNEEYFVAKVEGEVKKLDEDGVYSAVPFRIND